MIRRLIVSIVCGLSLLTCLALSAMFARSYFARDRLVYTFHNPSGQFVVKNFAFRNIDGSETKVAKAVEKVSVGLARGHLCFTHIGFIIPEGQRLLAPGDPPP